MTGKVYHTIPVLKGRDYIECKVYRRLQLRTVKDIKLHTGWTSFFCKKSTSDSDLGSSEMSKKPSPKFFPRSFRLAKFFEQKNQLCIPFSDISCFFFLFWAIYYCTNIDSNTTGCNTSNVANPQCFPCHTATTIQGEWSLWMSKRVSKVIQSFGASEVSHINRRGFNFNVVPSLIGIWCPLISRFGDVRRCMGN